MEQDGERFMSACDFICRFLGLIPVQNCNKETVRLLANVVDTTKDGLDAFFGTALLVSMLRQGDWSLVRRGTGPKGHWSESYIVVRSGGGESNPAYPSTPLPVVPSFPFPALPTSP